MPDMIEQTSGLRIKFRYKVEPGKVTELYNKLYNFFLDNGKSEDSKIFSEDELKQMGFNPDLCSISLYYGTDRDFCLNLKELLQSDFIEIFLSE